MGLSQKAQRDYDLVKQALGGNQDAYSQLFNQYKNSLYYMVLKMVNSPHEAEDLMMEAFAKAFRNLHQYSPHYAFSSWLFRIATNNCIDFLRKRRLEVVDVDSVAPAVLEAKLSLDASGGRSSNPEEKIIMQEKLGMVDRIIDTFQSKYSELIRLRYYEEYTYDELSVALDIPLGTVKAQLFRARKHMQPMLDRLKSIDESAE